MVERGLSDVIAYTVLMNGYCKVGRLQEACDLFVQMINSGIKPDVVAYSAIGWPHKGGPTPRVAGYL